MAAQEIADLLGRMAVDAINVQLRLDQHYETEIRRFAQLPALNELLQPLTPQRLQVARFDLSFRAAIAVTHEQEFAIQALPLNAQFFIRTSSMADRFSRLSFSVHQIPISKENRHVGK
jgi:hypothetical protein